MQSIKIKNGTLVNEGSQQEQDLLIKHGRIFRIAGNINEVADHTIDARGLHILPGVIDDQVHFREPGLTHKGEIATESRAAVAGGVTSYMEMPNVKPPTLTQELLQQKYDRAAAVSPANYSFYMGVSNDNLAEVLKTDCRQVCGIKVFMGSSTGNLLVDDEHVLSQLFRDAPCLIATHCEDEDTVRNNMETARAIFGSNVPMSQHPVIRSEEACYLSSSRAVELAKKHGTRLHILHISTARETELFRNDIPIEEKRITSEACIHHLWFTDADYEARGARIKWNPAVKTENDRAGIWQALLDDRIDVVATDHAPHTLEEKSNDYFNCPSGGPLIQHTLVAMLDFYHQGHIPLERIPEKMSHAVARCFQLKERGYLREDYWADLAIVNLNAPWKVQPENIRAKCGWSPFEGHTFQSEVAWTVVSGQLAYGEGRVDENVRGMRLEFDR